MPIATKIIGDKRGWRSYKARARGLPSGYREALGAVERYLLVFGPGSAERIQSMFGDLADLFEQSAADHTAIRDVVSGDPVEFAEGFLRNYTEDGWAARERRRLVDGSDRADQNARPHR